MIIFWMLRYFLDYRVIFITRHPLLHPVPFAVVVMQALLLCTCTDSTWQVETGDCDVQAKFFGRAWKLIQCVPP
jgi:hypothetical protein